MKVSTVIPIYKNTKYLGKCLESLSKQSYKDNEIILVNDGNKSINNQQLTISNLVVFYQNHQGPAIARNLGASKAKGEILVFVDSDMEFDSDFIKDLVTPIIKKKTKGTFSKNEYVANWQNIWARCWNYQFGLPNKKKLLDDYPDSAPVFRAILRSEFSRVGGFKPVGYADDWTLSEKLGYKAQVASGAKYYHYNPENLCQVFYQSKWRAKRNYKLGLVGEVFVLLKSLFPFSLIIGLYKSLEYKETGFFIFRIVFDLGTVCGIMQKLILKNYY